MTTRLLLGALGLAACGGGPGPGSDATDGALGQGGVRMAWATEPIVGVASPDLQIDSVTLQIANLRLVGDAAPGDARTSRTALTLTWSATAAPPDVVFDQAPPGLYSALEFELAPEDDGTGTGGPSVDVSGRVRVDGDLSEVTLHDRSEVAIHVALTLDLAAGTAGALTVSTNLGQVLDAVHWQDVPVVGGARVLDDAASADLGDIRQALSEAVTVTVP